MPAFAGMTLFLLMFLYQAISKVRGHAREGGHPIFCYVYIRAFSEPLKRPPDVAIRVATSVR